MSEGKIALVTGSAKGIGKAIALALAKEGATVIVQYNLSEKEAEETLREIKYYSKDSFLIKANLRNEIDIEKIANEIFKKLGRVDILVNNVGNFIYKPITEASSEEFRDAIESNLMSTFYCCKYFLPKMRENKFGRIINFGCAGCDRIVIRENTTPYYMAKTAVYMLTKALAAAEAKNGINLNVISPGITEFSKVKLEVPKGRVATIDDIVNAVMFLLSEKSDYVTGANIEVSGGWIPGF